MPNTTGAGRLRHLVLPSTAWGSSWRPSPHSARAASYLRIWLYLAKRSDRHGAPVLIWKEKTKATAAYSGH